MATYIDTGDRLAIQGEIVEKTEETRGQKETRVVFLDVRAGDGRTYQVEFFGRDVPADIGQYKRGDFIEVEFDINQREWNGKVFTRLSAVGLAHVAGAEQTQAAPPPVDEVEPF